MCTGSRQAPWRKKNEDFDEERGGLALHDILNTPKRASASNQTRQKRFPDSRAQHAKRFDRGFQKSKAQLICLAGVLARDGELECTLSIPASHAFRPRPDFIG